MTASSVGALSVTISAVDALSKPLLAMRRGAIDLSAGFAKLRAETSRGFGFDRLRTGARSAAESLSAIVPSLSAITAAGSVVGVYRLADGWARMGANLGRVAYRTRTAVPDLNSLQAAARIAGSSAEDMAQGLEGLGDAITDAMGGRDDTAMMYLRQLRVSLRDANGQARTAADVLPEVAGALEGIGNPALTARVMAALRLPPGLLPLIVRGRRGLRELREEADRYGATSEEGARAARQFEEAQGRLSLAGQGLANTLAARLAPVMVPLMDRFGTWLAMNREWVGLKVDQGIGLVADGFNAMPWQAIREGAGHVGEIARDLGQIGFPEGFGRELGEILRTWNSWYQSVRAFSESPLGRWFFDRDASSAGQGKRWSLSGPIGTLPEGDAAAAAEERQRRAETDGQDYIPRRRDDWLGRQWNGLLDAGRESAARRQGAAATAPGTLDDADRGWRAWRQVGENLAAVFGLVNRPERITGLAPGHTRRQAQDDLPAGDVTGREGGAPRGIRNNNPLNLSYVPGQQGLDASRPHDGRFGRYATMEAGIAASVRQMQIHAQRRGADTLGKMITLWAPPQDRNDTAGYIQRVAAETGLDPNARMDWQDAGALRRVVGAMARMENGRGVDAGQIERGVALGLGRPAAASSGPGQGVAPPAAGPSGAGEARPGMDIRVRVESPLPTTVTTRTSDGQSRVVRPELGTTP
ncbi:hypothetical protein SAMN02745194_03137 [Roseomonas rosea]|uniref:Uncharacterized protein n=1 Tax=Muricoccus roseus TaxID=198092 RepID=A0A1M6LDB5_9PROT|nr:hypothetical protein [Roseomonas rosea]SHJ69209.1 hypothetical protein SAMN02745194_03137 [Roseomonas rosea]